MLTLVVLASFVFIKKNDWLCTLLASWVGKSWIFIQDTKNVKTDKISQMWRGEKSNFKVNTFLKKELVIALMFALPETKVIKIGKDALRTS